MELLSIVLTNEPGALGKAARTLGDAKINIEALSVDTHSEVGLARVLVAEPAKAVEALKKKGFQAQVIHALRLPLANKPGALGKVCEQLSEAGVNIEFMLGGPASGKASDLLMSFEDFPKAQEVLKALKIEYET